MMTLKEAINEAQAKFSSCPDPVQLLEDLWVEAGFVVSFDEFCALVVKAL